MKLLKVMFLSAVLLLGTAPEFAFARGGHAGHGGGHRDGFRGGLGIVAALVAIPLIAAAITSPRNDPPPVVYRSNDVYTGPYVEQPVPPQAYAPPYQDPAQPQANVWYFCAESSAYYPYVTQCPSGWQPVSPIPPSR